MRKIALASLVALAACPPSPAKTDSGGGVAPKITSLDPANGPLTGGTTVSLFGEHFVDGARVTFGPELGVGVVVVSAVKLTVVTPAGVVPGPVEVTVTTAGGTAKLSNGFRYDAVVTRTIDEAVLENALSTRDGSGASTVKVTVRADVQSGTATKGAGQATGLRAQVGYATTLSSPPSMTDFTWVDAAYVTDVDGPAAGDLARDQYSGDVSLPGATTAEKTYVVTARFSGDQGQTWTLADHDGSANGLQDAQLSRVTLAPPGVGWCRLGGQTQAAPPSVRLVGSAAGPTIYGQVYQQGVTDQAGAGAGLSGQLGVGAVGSDPSTWSWTDAAYNADTGSGANDEFMATLANPGPGSYVFAFRFKVGAGTYSYCDADGLDNGFTEAQAGALTVAGAQVDRCVLQHPPAVDARQGRSTPLIYGRVFAAGVTDGTSPSTGLDVQVGTGPSGSLPDAGWTWSAASYNVKVSGGGEEWQASLAGPAPGTYHYAYRARAQGGAWLSCDLDSSDNGYQVAQAGVMTSKPFDVDECVLAAAAGSVASAPGGSAGPVRADVTALTLTEATGQGAGVTAEVGYGPRGSSPSTWTTWAAAAFEADSSAADRYAGSFTAPAAGTYDVAYRVKLGSNAWQYCDRDGSANGYQAAQAGLLTVAAPAIQSCVLKFVTADTVTTAMSGGKVTAYLRVNVPGLSSQAGATPGLKAQFGVGTQGVDARTSPDWGWKAASFNVDVAATGEDEYQLTFFPAYTGTRAVASRVSLDNGATWTFCDTDGSANGYDVAKQWAVTVTPHADFGWCNLQHPAAADAGQPSVIYGRVFQSGLTPNAAAPISAELGVGRKVEDPGLAWSWTAAGFSTLPADNSNEYKLTLTPDAGGWSYAYRFTKDGGTYCYGDLNASSDGFSGDLGGAPNLGTTLP